MLLNTHLKLTNTVALFILSHTGKAYLYIQCAVTHHSFTTLPQSYSSDETMHPTTPFQTFHPLTHFTSLYHPLCIVSHSPPHTCTGSSFGTTSDLKTSISTVVESCVEWDISLINSHLTFPVCCWQMRHHACSAGYQCMLLSEVFGTSTLMQ